jgi:hypothetical protein
MFKRDPARTEAAAAFRRRHDAAPLLRDQAPKLKALRLTFDDARPDQSTSGRSYARPVIVESARAHFEVRCLEPRCDGVHDLTAAILRAIREGQTSASITSECQDTINNQPCTRTLVCVCEASYRE